MERKKELKYISVIFSILLLSSLVISSNYDEKYNKASTLIDNGKYKKAISLYNEILNNDHELDSHKKSRLFNNIGYCYYKKGEFDNALCFYKDAIEIDSNYLLCINNISSVFIGQKKYKEALYYLKKACRIDEKYIKVVFSLFVVHAKLKNKELAATWLRRALELDEDYTIKRLKRNGLTNRQILKIREYLKKE